MKNQSAFLTSAEKIELRETDMPTVGSEDVLIKMRHVTICGSDITYFYDPTFVGAIVPPILPIILGHECSGEVIEVGSQVKHLKVGDLVAIEPGVGCGVCEYCLGGHYNLCREMDFMAAPPFHRGALSRYVSHPAKMVFKLPSNMDTIEGALTEPLAVGMHAVNRSGAQLGDTAVVIGTGTIGLMTIATLKARGLDTVIAVDLYDNRLEFAKKMGASHVINSSKEDPIARVKELLGLGANFVYETAGNSKTAGMTVDLVKPGGKIITVGNIHGETPFRFMKTNDNEVDIVSVFRYVNIYPMALTAVSSGKIKTKELITDRFPFEQTQQAFETAYHEKARVMKVLIEF